MSEQAKFHQYLQPLPITCITTWAPLPVRSAAALYSHRNVNPTVNCTCEGSWLLAPYEDLMIWLYIMISCPIITFISQCNNNRNKVHNKCKALESSWNHHPYPNPTPTPPLLPPVYGKLSSTKLVPGAKKVGDHSLNKLSLPSNGALLWAVFKTVLPLDSVTSIVY